MRALAATLAASGAAGALGYVCGRRRPLDTVQRRSAHRVLFGPPAPEHWPHWARRAAGHGWAALYVATNPREVATGMWKQAHPDPDARPVDPIRLLDPADRARRAAEREAEAARPPHLRFTRVHNPWWEHRHGLQLVVLGKPSPRATFWTAWGARRYGRKVLGIAEGRS